ncbi:MAG TPA: DUF1028 domain-containing protein [Gammaproteobacteria bacterium]|nr:DUF1028 domain-containing protein [Gammaproteobacteria bacterium]
MTFSLAANCERTGAFGIAVSSSSVCVTSRCAWVRAGAGAVASQNITDPALGDLGLELLGRGFAANRVLTLLVKAGSYPEHRQITVVDGNGETAHHSGGNTLGRNAVASGRRCIAAGNLLKRNEVPAAMVAAFEADPGAELAERLLLALEAGDRCGGEQGAVRSAGIRVAENLVWPTVDLRVDWHHEPITELRRIWSIFAPQKQDYVTRALDPTAAPSYGVPGDP